MLYIARVQGFSAVVNVVRIGQAANPRHCCDIVQQEIVRQTGTQTPIRLDLLRTLPDTPDGERIFHARFAPHQVCGEYFQFSQDMLTFWPGDYVRRLLTEVCACCSSTDNVERHHLYSVKDDCPDDLQIWLCRVCHERAHGMQTATRLSHRRLMLEGVARAKAAGKYKGRSGSIDVAQIRKLAAVMGPAEIAKTLGIARSSVYRLLAR